jgi:cytochrome P450
MKRLMGDSILFSRSTEEWSKKRKTLSPAFYKEKLHKMIDITKSIVSNSMERIREKHVKTGSPMDLISVTQNTHQKIILKCAMGVDVADIMLDYKEGGKVYKKRAGDMLRKIFHLTINRVGFPHVAFFPTYGVDMYLLPMEQDLKVNIQTIRNLFMDVVIKRREDMKKPGFVDEGDLLTIMLNEEIFQGNDEIIVDECMTFFFAGS